MYSISKNLRYWCSNSYMDIKESLISKFKSYTDIDVFCFDVDVLIDSSGAIAGCSLVLLLGTECSEGIITPREGSPELMQPGGGEGPLAPWPRAPPPIPHPLRPPKPQQPLRRQGHCVSSWTDRYFTKQRHRPGFCSGHFLQTWKGIEFSLMAPRPCRKACARDISCLKACSTLTLPWALAKRHVLWILLAKWHRVPSHGPEPLPQGMCSGYFQSMLFLNKLYARKQGQAVKATL